MAQSSQMIEELNDCFIKTAGNIIKYYGKISARLGKRFWMYLFVFFVLSFYFRVLFQTQKKYSVKN